MSDHSRQRQAARIVGIAGVAYLFQMAAGTFTQLYARGSLIAGGDAARTAHNVIESERLFRIGIASDLACYSAVLVATWALYVMLREVNRNIALLAVLFRLMELAIHFNVTLNSLTVLRLVSGDASLAGIDPGQRASLAYLAIGAQGAGITVGFMLLGIGSALFAWLMFRSSFIPRLLAGWGVFASLLLAANTLAGIVWPEIRGLQMVVMLPMGIYEVGLGVALLVAAARMRRAPAAPG